MNLLTSPRKKANSELTDICRHFHDSIPLSAIFGIIERNTGLTVVDEEGSPWSGFMCGSNSDATFDLRDMNKQANCENAVLWMSWYKMQTGRYEVVAYLS